MCAFVVLGLVFPYQVKRLAWGTSKKLPILCRDAKPQLNPVSRVTKGQAVFPKPVVNTEEGLCGLLIDQCQ